MADQPALQKPPGYRSPSATPQQTRTVPAPRRNVLPTTYQPSKKRKSCCRTSCCCCCIAFLIIVLVLLVCGAILYLWFDPKLPTFHLQAFRVNQFNVSSNPDGSFLTAQTMTRIEMKNPNANVAIYYGDTEVEISAGENDDETGLGSGNLPAFKQIPNNVTSLKVVTQVKNQAIDDALAKRLGGEFKKRSLKVNVMANTKVGLGLGTLKIGMLSVRVNCGGITMQKLDSEMPKCSVRTLRWLVISS